MKKLLSIVLGVVLTLGAVALTSSCQKDIDNAKALVGTSWVGAADGYTYTIEFKSQTTFEMIEYGTLTSPSHKIFKGVFIITGAQSSLKGSYVTLTFESDWTHDWHSGEFVSDTELRMGSIPFKRVLK